MKNIFVLGSNFGGISAALELKRKLGKEASVTVVSPSRNFVYIPSLIWVPFGKRKMEDISFDIVPVLSKKGINFLHEKAKQVIPQENTVILEKSGAISYDYIVIATGAALNYNILPHLNPDEGYVNTIVTPSDALKTFEAFEKLVQNPGPVIVGATQSASCMGAGYEYLFNLDKQLRKRGIRDKVEIHWVTPEPFLGDFGIEGIKGGETMLKAFMKLYNIKHHTAASIEKIEKNKMTLKDGTVLPFAMAVLIPPFLGAEVMRNSPSLVDEKGFVVTNEGYQHIQYKNVYAAGLAVEVIAPFKTCSVPYGVPKTGYPTDVMGKIVAENITNDIFKTGKFIKKPFGKMPGVCIMDAGDKEVWILTNHLFKPRQIAVMIPNVIFDIGKLILEKYFLWKNRHGLAYLP